MSQKCANPKCENPVVSIAGKRPRKYCSSRCTSAHWQALHYKPKNPKRVIAVPCDDGTWMLSTGEKVRFEYERGEITHFKPRENTYTLKQGKVPEQENKGAGEAENAADRIFTPIDTIQDRIGKIERDLKLPPKYLPQPKRKQLEKELYELKLKL